MLRIDLGQVEELNNTIRQQMSKLQEVRNHLQMTSAQVDPQIRSRRNIESRLRRINHELQDLEYQLRNLHTFIQHSVGRYRDAETNLAKQASHYGDEYRPRRYAQASANQNQFDRIGAFEVNGHELTPQDFIHARKAILDYFKKINAGKAIYDAFHNLIERAQNNARIMKELNWSYVGMDVQEAIDKLMSAGSIRSIAAKDALERLWQEREALQDTQKNASLDLMVEQLLILAEIDPNGVEDYIRRKEQQARRSKEIIPDYQELKEMLNIKEEKSTAEKAMDLGKGIFDFLIWDDVTTLVSEDATAVERAIAAASLLPVGKILKIFKLGSKASSAVSAGDKVIGGAGDIARANRNVIIDSATQAKKGGETVVGHALQKHAGRNPDIWGKVKGGPDQINQTALKHLEEIVDAPGDFVKVINDRGIEFLEKKLPDGRGVRLNLDGTFKGFIDQ